MTKRNNNFDENPSKKSKLDIDDLWGDDLNADDIDDCLMLATQVYQQESINCSQINNISILPSYDAFKPSNRFVFTSTQLNQVPSTSKLNISQNDNRNNEDYFFKRPCLDNDFKNKFEALKEQYEAKNGENSILRSQLNSLQSSLKLEYEKNQREVNEKLQSTLKELHACRSQLQFKNLEVVNLKHKVIDVTKANISNATLNELENVETPPKKCKSATCEDKIEVQLHRLHLRPVINKELPLKNRIDPALFHITNTKDFYTQFKTSQIGNLISNNNSSQINYIDHSVNNKTDRFLLYLIHANLTFLVNSTTEEINSESNFWHINKIIIILKMLLRSFHTLLKEIEDNMISETIRKQDMKYLERRINKITVKTSLFDATEWCENEMGIQLRQLITFVSELLPVSSYMQEIIFEKRKLVLKNSEELKVYFSCLETENLEDKINNIDVLDLLLSCVTIIGAMRMSNKCVGFLCALSLFFSKICNIKHNVEHVNNTLFKTIHEIIFSRPNEQVLYYLSIYLREAAIHTTFINSMCMSKKNGLKKNSKKIVYFDKSVCVFQVFNMVYKDCVLNGDKNDLYIDTNYNMLKFIVNAFNSKSKWLHYRENDRCNCLTKIIDLSIEIIYEILQFYVSDNVIQKSEDGRFQEMLFYFINILHILNFKNYDLIENYINSCGYFKAVIRIMRKLNSYLSEEDCKLLDQLNVYEEVSDAKNGLGESKFSKIPLWK